MSSNETNIRKENRKNIPKFLGIMLGCMLLGGVFGYASSSVAPANIAAVLDRISAVLVANAWWLLIALFAVTLAACLCLNAAAKSAFSRWDGEDEQTEKRIDNLMNSLVGVSNGSLILSLAFFSLFALNLGQLDRGIFLPGFIAFIINGAVVVLFQQQAIDMSRRLNPEKTVSMYDPKFHKKWMEHCDEREVQAIGRASYMTMRVFNIVCPILWLALMLLNMFTGGWMGIMPCLTVALIWGIVSTAYVIACSKVEK